MRLIPESDVWLTDTLDLTQANLALLTFWAKWDIEEAFDYAMLFAHDVDTQNLPPCVGSTPIRVRITNRSANHYEGLQSDWVQERIDLTDFIGQRIELRLSFHTDGIEQRDGFYLDDLGVTLGG